MNRKSRMFLSMFLLLAGLPGATMNAGVSVAAEHSYYIPYYINDSESKTGIALRNLDESESASVVVTVCDRNGKVLETKGETIGVRAQKAYLAGGGGTGEGWLLVESDRPLAGLAFVGTAVSGTDYMFDITLISGLATRLHVPHVGQNDQWDTKIFVCNPGVGPNEIQIAYVSAEGRAAHSKKHTVPGRGSGVYKLRDLVGSNKYKNGSVEIAAERGVAAFALYDDLKAGGTSYAGISAIGLNVAPAETLTNSLGMTFVRLPEGVFTMGSPEDEPGRYDEYDREKRHRVTLTKPFFMQTTEVTQGQWKAVMGSNPSHFDECGDGCPVETVSWEDARKFVQALGDLDGENEYRLPTEAEWEYAARAGTTTAFSFGNCLSADQANYEGNAPLAGCPAGEFREKTVPVASFPANPWRLYDMHGNVGEWCQDWAEAGTEDAVDPQGPEYGTYRIRRGGSWERPAKACRSAFRDGSEPYNSYSQVGFRLVLIPAN